MLHYYYLMRTHYVLWIVLTLALALRLWLAPMRGHVHDIEQLKLWTETAVFHTPLALYTQSSTNYPPFANTKEAFVCN